MLQAGFHIQDHNVIPVQHHIVDDAFEHHMFRTDTAAAPGLHRTQYQQLHSIAHFSISVRDVIHLRIYTIELIVRASSRALFYQFAHPGDGDDRVQCLFIKPQCQSEICIRIHICGQHLPAFLCVESG